MISNSRQQNQTIRTARSPNEKERELARECGRFADLCNYLSRNNVVIPAAISDALGRVAVLEVAERTIRMKALNEQLMSFLNDLGFGTSVPQ